MTCLRALLLLFFVLPGCGTEAAPVPTPSGAAGSGTATKADSASNRCSFVLVDGDAKVTWSGTARARMNGSGNLLVRCTGGPASSASTAELELHFGNGTFDGPRTYIADDFSSDGSVVYRPDEGASFETMAKGASCSLVLDQAPLEARKNSVPRGGAIAGTFRCSAVVDRDGRSLAIEDGELAATVE